MGVVQSVGDEQDAAQAAVILAGRHPLHHGDDGGIQIGKPGGVDAGLFNCLLPCLLGGEGVAVGHGLPHEHEHHAVYGTQGIAQGGEGLFLLLLLRIAEGAGLVHHAVVGDGKRRVLNGGDGAGRALTVGSDGDCAALQGRTCQIQGIALGFLHGMQEFGLLLRRCGNGQCCQQGQAQKNCKSSFHDVYLNPLSFRIPPSGNPFRKGGQTAGRCRPR